LLTSRARIFSVYLLLSLLFFFLQVSPPHLPLHSFPTRRSSDLTVFFMARATSIFVSRKIAFTASLKSLEFFLGILLKIFLRKCRSEEHTSELQSRFDLVCRLLLEKKKKTI